MARRKKEEAEIYLFPVLDVLINAIGALIVIILSFALVSVKSAVVAIEVKGAPHFKAPIYIECHHEKIVIHPENDEGACDKLEAEGATFMQLVQRISSKPTQEEYLVFAVYPDGIRCFEKARKIALYHDIDVGFEPYNEDWELTLPPEL